MKNNLLYLSGILGASFFVMASFLGGLQFDNYDPVSQYISETMATGSPYGKMLRFFGYIPSGILLTIFSFSGFKKFPKSNLITLGFVGLGIFYGIATVVVGVFPCDVGCNKEFIDPSISQIIHNFTGALTYVFVPICHLLIGMALFKSKSYLSFSKFSILSGLTSSFFIGLLLFAPLTNFTGLLQRIIEGIFIIWVFTCVVILKKKNLN